MKKLFIFTFICFFALFLHSCSNERNIYTVTYISDGEIYSVCQTNENSEIIFPTEPAKSGFIFMGWYYNNTEWDESNTVNEDMTLVAEWIQDTASIPNGSEENSDNENDSNDDATIETPPADDSNEYGSDNNETQPPNTNEETPPASDGKENTVPGIICMHEVTKWETVISPSCTEQGQDNLVCTFCGKTVTVRFNDKTEHNFKSETKEPTCTQDGVKNHTCIDCGFEHSEAFGEAMGHKYGIWLTIIEATCSSTGRKRQACERCSAFITEDIPKTEHNLKTPVSNSDGSHTQECGSCDFSLISFCTMKENISPASCVSLGTAIYSCANCSYSYTKKLSPLGHSYKNGFCIRCEDTKYELELSKDKSYYIFKGIGSSSDTDIIIPEYYLSLPVTEIAYQAFFGNSNIKSVYVPSSIKSIGAFAFYYCENLSCIEFESKDGWSCSEYKNGTNALNMPSLTKEYAIQFLTDDEIGYPDYYLFKY